VRCRCRNGQALAARLPSPADNASSSLPRQTLTPPAG
jgi:hypothetical protein